MKKIVIFLTILILSLSKTKALIEDIEESKPEIRRKNWITNQIKKGNEVRKKKNEEDNLSKLRRLNEIEAESNATPKKTTKTIKKTTKKKVLKKKKITKKKTTTKNIKKEIKKNVTVPNTNKKSSTMKKTTTKK